MFALVLPALPTGILLLADPSGKGIGGETILPVIKGAIGFINDFSLIGIWLMLVYGVFPLVLIVGLIRRVHGALYLTWILGATVVAWIGVELALFYGALGFTPMYPLIGGIGTAILLLASLPSVRHYILTTNSRKQQARFPKAFSSEQAGL